MHILKILSFLTIFERLCTTRGDSKRFGNFSGIVPSLIFETSPQRTFCVDFCGSNEFSKVVVHICTARHVRVEYAIEEELGR